MLTISNERFIRTDIILTGDEFATVKRKTENEKVGMQAANSIQLTLSNFIIDNKIIRNQDIKHI